MGKVMATSGRRGKIQGMDVDTVFIDQAHVRQKSFTGIETLRSLTGGVCMGGLQS